MLPLIWLKKGLTLRMLNDYLNPPLSVGQMALADNCSGMQKFRY